MGSEDAGATPTQATATDEVSSTDAAGVHEGADSSGGEPLPQAHPIAQAIDTFLHHARDTVECALLFVPAAAKHLRGVVAEQKQEMAEAEAILERDDLDAPIAAAKRLFGVHRTLDRVAQSELPRTLERGLFLGLFASYDAFSGQLLQALFSKRPELFQALNRTMTVSEILGHASFDDLRTAVLSAEIETFRRKSYTEQVEQLESTFGLKLKAFEAWPRFVEAGQRRNLIAHCDGTVTDQYLIVCGREGVKLPGDRTTGTRLGLGAKYFISRTYVLMEVAVKLAQTLWRKVVPDELETADKHLNDTIFGFLQDGNWRLAHVLGEFAASVPKMARDIDRKIAIVNNAIALKFGGAPDQAETVLRSVDWSGAAIDFKLAEAVLLDRLDDASSIMRKIGKRSQLVNEGAYHTWPLFHAFREAPQFYSAYEEIYGYPFSSEARKAAEAAQSQTGEVLEAAELETKGIEAASELASELPLAQTVVIDAEKTEQP